MTELLYLTTDSPLLQADGVIESILIENNQVLLVLDKTPFYPEGGGQPSDVGFIENYSVVDVQKREGLVYHTLDLNTVPAEFLVGNTVNCLVDAKRRMDLTQQHTGQHLLSALAFTHLGGNTVGFHLSENYTTIDLDKKLMREDIVLLEQLFFESIAKDAVIFSEYPDSQTLDDMPLRKQPKVTQDIRVIIIDGIDHSPCGGTHLSSTKALMGLKITKFENYKGGTRLEFVCGWRFLETIQRQGLIIEELSKKMSASQDQLLEAYGKKESQLNAMKLQIDALQNRLIAIEVAQWLSDLEDDLNLGDYTPVHFRVIEDCPLDYMKKLSQTFLEQESRIGIFLASKNEGLAQFVFNRHKELQVLNCKALLAKASEVFDIKGGGSPMGVQGSLHASDLDAFIDYLEQLI